MPQVVGERPARPPATSPRAIAAGARFAPLDGIRAVAVIAVLGYHGGVLPGGYLGVDIFFVLSGFLITTLMLAEFERTSTLSVRRFWLRRAFRLLPALVAYLALGLVAAAALKTEAQQQEYAEHAVTSLLGVNNWLRVFVPDSAGAWDGHLWSLSVEAQFYLGWPLLLLAVLGSRRWRPRLGLVLAALVVVVAGWRILVVSGVLSGLAAARLQDHWYFGTDTRADPLLVGALLAVLWRRGVLHRFPERAWAWLAAAAWALLAVGVAVSPTLEHRPGWLAWGGFTAVAVVAAVAVAAAVVAPDRGVSRLFGLRPVVWLGGISYALYLWHFPVVAQLDTTLAPRIGLVASAALALVVASVVAWGSTRFLERPIGRLRGRVEAKLFRSA